MALVVLLPEEGKIIRKWGVRPRREEEGQGRRERRKGGREARHGDSQWAGRLAGRRRRRRKKLSPDSEYITILFQ